MKNKFGNFEGLETYFRDGWIDLGKATRFNPKFAPGVVREEAEAWWANGSAIPANPLVRTLTKSGVDISGSYVADFLGNVSGGLSQDFAYTHTLSFQTSFDLEHIAGWRGASLNWSFADNAGSNLQNVVGNQFTPSNLYGPNTFYFAELYLLQKFFDGNLQFKLGQLCAADDFAASPIYGNYLNLAFNGNPFVPFDTYPISAFPAPSWGAHVLGNLQKDDLVSFYGQSGIYQVSDRIGENAYHGLDYSIRPGDGVMILAEVGWTPNFFASAGSAGRTEGKKTVPAVAANPGYPGHYKVGGFYSNWEYPTFSGAPNVPNAYGFYFLADQQVTMEESNPSEGLVLWGTIGWTPQQQLSGMPFSASSGAQYTGLLPGRSNDITLFGLAYGQGSIDAINAAQAAGGPGSSYEIALEATYVVQLNQWLSVQPDLQYIVNPGGTGTIPNAWILGGQVTVNF